MSFQKKLAAWQQLKVQEKKNEPIIVPNIDEEVVVDEPIVEEEVETTATEEIIEIPVQEVVPTIVKEVVVQPVQEQPELKKIKKSKKEQ